ncbi:hypothetical protein CERSUDRAFT_98766 [Gelatoporia subvermispora B]|uniref:DUF6533 domain-containing protein n=1 Tax=Ceriporiopsis subvermispora (strain B) TaxID=914234 RepID=M2PC03_CERS8|nr:hypothetical protein CERSUDRAFT_98766 [Gelatoporia subvermispora B]
MALPAQEAAEIISLVQSSFVSNCCSVASSAFVLYDFILTTSQEVEFMWGRKWSSVTLLYQLNKWATIVWAVEQFPATFVPFSTVSRFVVSPSLWTPMVLTIQTSISSCLSFNYVNYVAILVLFGIWAVFSGVRTFAISGSNWALALVVFLLSVVPVATNATYVTWRDARRNNIRAPFATILLKDGTLYFIALLIINVVNIIGITTASFNTTVTYFATPLSSIIVTRFLLNLRQLASIESYDSETSRAANAEAEQGTWLSQIRFNHSFVDNMGEDLEHSIDMQDRDSGMTWLESDNAVAANGEVNVVSSGDEPSVVPDNASRAGASTLHQMTDA